MLRILLCGEGPTDYGKQDYITGVWEDGPVQVLIKKICDANNVDFVITTVHKRDVREMQVLGNYQNVEGHGVKAQKLAQMAARDGYNTAVCYVDEDRKGHREITQSIIQGFNAVAGVVGIPLVAQRMIESWLLADANAFYAVYKRQPPNLPPRPETIWGIEGDLTTSHPKNVIRTTLAFYHQEPCQSVFVSIADEIDLRELARKCPTSFRPFYDALVEAAEA